MTRTHSPNLKSEINFMGICVCPGVLLVVFMHLYISVLFFTLCLNASNSTDDIKYNLIKEVKLITCLLCARHCTKGWFWQVSSFALMITAKIRAIKPFSKMKNPGIIWFKEACPSSHSLVNYGTRIKEPSFLAPEHILCANILLR